MSGKTTSTHALGVALAERGRRVLLVDLDPQASLTWACGLDPDALETSVHDVLLKRGRAADAIVALDPPAPRPADGPTGTLDLLPSTIDLAGAELHLLTKTGREYVLAKALATVGGDYDRILLDCPPSLGILTINGLTAADEVLIPLQCESLSQRGVSHTPRRPAEILVTVCDEERGRRIARAICVGPDGQPPIRGLVLLGADQAGPRHIRGTDRGVAPRG